MPDRFTEVTNQSWFSRIGGAFTGIIFGIILIAVAFPLLFWNEGRAVARAKTLQEGRGAAVSVAAESVGAGNEGKLVHVSGMAATGGKLADSTFGISVAALKLKRTAEIYQWKETEHTETSKQLGGGSQKTTTYEYEKAWSDHLIASGNFKVQDGHRNPSAMPWEPREQMAAHVTLGAFALSHSLIAKIDNYTPYPVETGDPLPAALKGKAVQHDGGFYMGHDPAAPAIGDERISFQVAMPGTVTVVARQVGGTFEPYQTKAGGTIELLETGDRSVGTMFGDAEHNNAILTWVLRAGGFLLMFLGFVLLFAPVAVFADVLPFLGCLVGAGTGFIAFLLAVTLSLGTIAVAWFAYRPLLSIVLVVAALGIAMLFKGRFRKKTRAA